MSHQSTELKHCWSPWRWLLHCFIQISSIVDEMNMLRFSGRKKVKDSHTLSQALGLELTPVYRQLAHRWLLSYPPGSRLPLLSTRPAVTFPVTKHHCPLADTKLYCLVTEAHTCEQLAQGCYAALLWVGFEPITCWSHVQCFTRAT